MVFFGVGPMLQKGIFGVVKGGSFWGVLISESFVEDAGISQIFVNRTTKHYKHLGFGNVPCHFDVFHNWVCLLGVSF